MEVFSQLMRMGFPGEQSQIAINDVGVNLDKCVSWLTARGHGSPSRNDDSVVESSSFKPSPSQPLPPTTSGFAAAAAKALQAEDQHQASDTVLHDADFPTLGDFPTLDAPAAAQVAKQMVQMTRNTPCCTQAAVAACSCTWCCCRCRTSTRTPRWPCSSSIHTTSSGSKQSQPTQHRHVMGALCSASQSGLCHSGTDLVSWREDECQLRP